METESKLLPVLRDAVSIVKMVLFKELKPHLMANYPQQDSAYIGLLAGAVVNELFGTPNNSPNFERFRADNLTCIENEIGSISEYFDNLQIPLTDALRVQFLCDSLVGIDGSPTLAKAEALGILLVDREVPLPKAFMAMVRRVGAAHKILQSANYPAAEGDKGG
jgi:hypothetical protein